MPRPQHRSITIFFFVVLALLSSCATPKSIESDDPRIKTVLETAYSLDGTPYCYAGSTPKCFDCSGFVNHCFDKIGVKLPRTSKEMFGVGIKINDDELITGDLVFFNTNGKAVSHVGIYSGSGSFIHASTSSGVMTSRLSDRYWGPRYLGARRVVSQ